METSDSPNQDEDMKKRSSGHFQNKVADGILDNLEMPKTSLGEEEGPLKLEIDPDHPCIECEEEMCQCDVEHPPPLKIFIPFTLFVGLLFGIALEKSNVYKPAYVVNQMLMEDFLMLRIFIFAMGFSMLAMSFMSKWSKTKAAFEKAHSFHITNPRGIPLVFIASFVGGIGMTISGACAGTVIVQLGAGIQTAGYTFIGILLAGLLYPLLEKFIHPFVSKKTCPKTALEALMNIHYFNLAFPMGLFLILGSTLVWIFAFNAGPHYSNPPWFMAQASWPLIVCGALIGIAQIIMIAIVKVRGLGTSMAYVNIMALISNSFFPKATSKFRELHAAATGRPIQLFTFMGMVLGAFLSSYLAGTWASATGVSIVRALVGGFLVEFGARAANGCTSGHGITGGAHLAIISFIAVAGMFGGGIATAMLSKYAFGLNIYV